MAIKRLPRVTFHYRVLFPKARLPVLTDVFCCVKDILGWNLALLVWERSKNNFLFEMYWLFRLCVPCKPGTCSSFFFRTTSFPVARFMEHSCPSSSHTFCGLKNEAATMSFKFILSVFRLDVSSLHISDNLSVEARFASELTILPNIWWRKTLLHIINSITVQMQFVLDTPHHTYSLICWYIPRICSAGPYFQRHQFQWPWNFSLWAFVVRCLKMSFCYTIVFVCMTWQGRIFTLSSGPRAHILICLSTTHCNTWAANSFTNPSRRASFVLQSVHQWLLVTSQVN